MFDCVTNTFPRNAAKWYSLRSCNGLGSIMIQGNALDPLMVIFVKCVGAWHGFKQD